jgi:hypothetical protein
LNSDLKKTKTDRLISLEGYRFKVSQKKDKYYFILEPNMDDGKLPKLEFRCDTLDELDIWTSSLVPISGEIKESDEVEEIGAQSTLPKRHNSKYGGITDVTDISASSANQKTYRKLR